MKSTNQLYIRGIDHLRALAALLVLFYHTIHSGNQVAQDYVPGFAPLSLLEEGHTGVALFITITGFIFTRIIGDRDINYPRFLFNRFIRIFPLLFILSLFAAFIESGVHDTDPLAMLKFFNLFGGGVYWGTWTLVVEFQFYLFFPAFYLYFREHWRGRVSRYLPFLGLIVLGLAFRLIFFTLRQNAQDLGYWTIFGRIDQFMCGAMACLLLQQLRDSGLLRNRYAGLAIAAVSLLALMLVYHFFNSRLLFTTQPSSPSAWWLVVPTIEGLLYAGLLFGWVCFTQGLAGRVSGFFAYIGSISYSSYLLHFAVLQFCVQLTNRSGLVFSDNAFTHKLLLALLLVYPLTLLLSVLSFELVEKPFFRRRVNYIEPVSGSQ